MPIRRGAISCSRFRLDGEVPKDVKRWLTKALTVKAFEPIDKKGDEDRAVGFVELENPDATEFRVGALFEGDYALFAWRVETLKVPQASLREELLAWAKAFEGKEGRKPGRREKAEQKDTLRRAHRARTPPTSKVFDVSLLLPQRELLVWANSAKVVDEVQAELEDGLKVRLVQRVPAALVSAAVLDTLSPTPELFGGVR